MKRAQAAKRPTMKDVATRSGVSVSTVSHVINGSRFVDPETRDKVERVIQDLDYRPNLLAQSLRSKKSQLMGIIVPNIREAFFTELVKATESLASAEGLNVILCDSEDNLDKELRYLETLVLKGIEAIVLCPTSDDPAHYQHLNLEDLAVVQVDRKISGLNLDFVGIDSEQDVQLAARHCVEAGARELAYIGYRVNIGPLTTVNFSMAAAIAAFEQTSRGGITKREDRVLLLEYKYAPLVAQRQQRVTQIVRWLQANPSVDAVICGNQTVCHETLLAVAELGLGVPEDLRLVSLGDNQWLPLLSTPVTATQHPVEKIAHSTLKLIQRRLKGPGRGNRAKQLLHPSELIVRSSSLPQSLLEY